MQTEYLERVMALAEKLDDFPVATADAQGWPHIASTGAMSQVSEERVALREWFCPTTLENVQQNPNIAIVVWERKEDVGYQLMGVVEQMNDLALLDGYTEQLGAPATTPQVERELIVRVDRVLAFSRAPHMDTPLPAEQV